MPIYDVEHFCDLSEAQMDKIAEEITRIHSEKFVTPKLFVNVNFTDIRAQPTYIGGKRKKSNRIIANVRAGGGRTKEMFNDTCSELIEAWTKIVGSNEGDKELRAIFVLGSMIAGAEAGFSIPSAGEDAEWLKKNMAAFKKKAAAGDEDFVEMMEEMRSRPAFKSAVNGA